MKAVSTGYTIPIPTSRIGYNQNNQCPGIIMIQCPGILIIQCPGIIMSCKTVTHAIGILLNRFPVLLGTIQIFRFQVLLLPAKLCQHILIQCPGLLAVRMIKPHKYLTMLSALPRPPKKKRDRKYRRERRARERENKIASFIHHARWANQSTAVPGSPVVPARVTQSTPQAVDPISSMRTAVYPPSRIVGNPTTNDNSPFQIGQESRRNLGLYKPAVPDQNQDTWAYDFVANSSGIGPPSPTRTFAASSSGKGIGAGIVYPLQPRGRRPDVCIQVEAALPEPAALLRPDLPKPESPTQPQEAPANLQRASRRLSRKRRRNRSTAVFRPAKCSPERRDC